MALFTIAQLRDQFSNKKLHPSEVVDSYCKTIDEKDDSIKSFISVDAVHALEAAVHADDQYRKGTARPLEGIPLGVKDTILVSGMRATAGSKILEDYVAPYDATAVARLKNAGAIILGKTNCDEFAMGASTEFSAFFPTHNPYDLKRVPGGSSGGSAAAVAAQMCPGALGSDTGGSIRQPSGFCGVVGFKPTYGHVSRYGLIAMSSSLDQIGPIAHTVDDAKILFDIMSGKDPMDATSLDVSPAKKSPKDLSELVVGIPTFLDDAPMQEEVRSTFNETIDGLRSQGATIKKIPIEHFHLSLAVYYIIVTSEVSSNLARYDGIRYGKRITADSLIEEYIATRDALFGDEAKRRILLGTFTLSKGYKDKYYKQAIRVRNVIARETRDAFQSIHCLLLPTSPTLPFALGERLEDPLAMYFSDLFTVPANIANVPALSLPAGMVSGLPFGLQCMGKSGEDNALFHVAKLIESGIQAKS